MKDLNKFEEFNIELHDYLKKHKLSGLTVHFTLRRMSFFPSCLATITEKQFKHILKLCNKFEVTFSYKKRGLDFTYN